MAPSECPVDHSTRSASSSQLSSSSCSSESLTTTKATSEKCPVDHSRFGQKQQHSSSDANTSLDKCPVDHKTRSTWTSLGLSSLFSPSASPNTSPSPSTSSPSSPDTSLPTAREISSIPRADASENWVYPSEAQFFAAMARKQHNPRATDMRVIVPIHNAVNERAWSEVMGWERGWGGEKCGGVKLVSFKGRPGERTPKAWIKTLLGYQAPFDRHDWVVDRCGTRMRYVIDFYTGKSKSSATSNVSFYLDVRPALDNWEAVKMRTSRFFERWVGGSSLPWTRAAAANDSGVAGSGRSSRPS